MRCTSQPSACLTFSTATRPPRISRSTSETMPAWRATCVSTTGRPVTFESRTRRLFLLDHELEQDRAERKKQCVEPDEHAQPWAHLRRLAARDDYGRARGFDRRQDYWNLNWEQEQR